MKTAHQGVILRGLQIQMKPALSVAEKIWEDLGPELIITCGLDGVHSAGSYHYSGYAVDKRTSYFNDNGREAFLRLRAELRKISPFYDVVLHKTHIHTEFDYYRWAGYDWLKEQKKCG